MSRPRTAIRLMWARPDLMDAWGEAESPEEGCICILAVPYNPTARLAMIRRTVKTLWPKATGKARERHEATVMYVLGTALTPSR